MVTKDYVLLARVMHCQRVRIAGTLRTGRRAAELAVWECVARALANALARDNPGFNASQWLSVARDGLMGDVIDATCGPKTGCADIHWPGH